MLFVADGDFPVYELESLARMFFFDLQAGTAAQPPEEGDFVFVQMRPEGADMLLTAHVRYKESEQHKSQTAAGGLSEKEHVLLLALLLYRCAVELTDRKLRWGVLTGIRPIKLYHTLLAQGFSDIQAAEHMRTHYAVDPVMSALAMQIARAEQVIQQKSAPKGFSLYVSIPFCPQRCSYCSFVSQSVEQMRPLIPRYVEQLCVELEDIGKIARALDLTLQTVYFGGGTPTTLTAQQLKRIFSQIECSFDLSQLLEYTVEAGRPDTIDAERLSALRTAGVTRISINPQSMNDKTLATVGRLHTAQDIERAFSLARQMGFDCINMDVIAGLPGETPEEFISSFQQVLALDPENVTVHTLTLKRASSLAEQRDAALHLAQCGAVAQMVDAARAMAYAAGFFPYYLYRQKNSIGALDNTGYAKTGREGIYNVFIMDETHTILAAGAGAVTKLREPGGAKIERIFNFKYPTEYLKSYEAIRRRKERVGQFYEDCQRG